MIRVVFMGTPAFAVPSLEGLVEHPEIIVAGVITQPDRPAGRGQQTRISAVKQAALTHELPVFQPESVNSLAAIDRLRDWAPQAIVVAAYGQILRNAVLTLPPHGCVNVHASLLPRWRGAAPIHYALRAGDEQTGITIMKMDEGLDTGPILLTWAIDIAPDETAQSLHDRLAALGGRILPETLINYVHGKITPTPQPEEGVTVAPTLSKDDGEIDWTEDAPAIDRHVRAYDPWPGTYTFLDGQRLNVISGEPLPDKDGGSAPGTLLEYNDGLAVQTGNGLYRLVTIQPAGKRKMSAEAYLAGHQDDVGKRLGKRE